MLGPVPEASLMALYRKGTLPHTTKVCQEGYSAWRSIHTLGKGAVRPPPSLPGQTRPNVAGKLLGVRKLATPQPPGFRIYGVLLLFFAASVWFLYVDDPISKAAAQGKTRRWIEHRYVFLCPALAVGAGSCILFGYRGYAWYVNRSPIAKVGLGALAVLAGIALDEWVDFRVAQEMSSPREPSAQESMQKLLQQMQDDLAKPK